MSEELKQTLIADLDGTIVKCGRYYNAANQQITDLIANEYAVSPVLARELLEYLEVWAIRANEAAGFTRERYPRSSAAAVAAAGAAMTGDLYHHHIFAAWKTADDVFAAPYDPFDGAVATLKQYADAGWQVLVYTKGDFDVQMSKYNNAGLKDATHGIVVVQKKDVANLKRFCTEHQIDRASSVYVGDSVRDDMTPAVQLGIYAVRVKAQPEDVWIHDSVQDMVSDAVVDSLADLPKVVAPNRFDSPHAQLCANCGQSLAIHMGNTGAVHPCWRPLGSKGGR